MSALKAGQELAHIVEVRSIPWATVTAKTLLLEETHIDSPEAWARLHSIRQRLEQINAQGAGTQPANQQGETAC